MSLKNPNLGNHRACAGKNLAKMELQISIATIFRRYAFVPEDPGKPVSKSPRTNHHLQLSLYFLLVGRFRWIHP